LEEKEADYHMFRKAMYFLITGPVKDEKLKLFSSSPHKGVL